LGVLEVVIDAAGAVGVLDADATSAVKVLDDIAIVVMIDR